MEYFDNLNNVRDYIKMAAGYDGAQLIEVLKSLLPENSTLLELGMGPGIDFGLLEEFFQVTGSDSADGFVKIYLETHPNANVLVLDAVTIEIEKSFNGVFSNKVLQHLSQTGLKQSFKRQSEILNDDGVLLHSFWYGDKEENHHGLRTVYYTKASIEKLVPEDLEIVEFEKYTEMEKDDSFYVVLKQRG
ncbi:MAG: class I SAM-dependent methyltransferase [SAR324 cluster bacterium]|nr:class I SAM-dependent methyltransferase [SAR324 cluster bacterium]